MTKTKAPEALKMVMWGYNGEKWVKRKTITFVTGNAILGDNMEVLKVYEQTHGHPHAYFPLGIDPNTHRIINVMRELSERHLKAYHNDFYHFDIPLFFQAQQDIIWITREAGTNLFSLNPYESVLHKENALICFNHYMQQGRKENKLFRINAAGVHSTTFIKALALINANPIKETEQ